MAALGSPKPANAVSACPELNPVPEAVDQYITKENGKQFSQVSTKRSSQWARTLRVGSIALFSGLGSFLFGLDVGYIGPIIESASFKESVMHITADAVIDSGVEGLVVSLFSVGAIVMAFPLISSYFVDVWGRKMSIVLGGVIFIVGNVLQATANSMVQMFIGRFVAGLSIGLLSTVVVLYQSEMAPTNLRGAFSTLYQLMITFGILIAAIIDQALVEQDDGWRWIIFLMCAPAFILSAGMLFLPRSPRWLVQKGDKDKALEVLCTIRTEEDAHTEHNEIIKEQAATSLMGQPRWAEIFQGKIGRLLVLGISLQLLQQLVGMNAFMYFGPKIFNGIGFDGNLFTTINNLVNFISTFPAVLLADVAGRRTLLLCSSAGMTLACIVVGTVGMATMTLTDDGNWTVSSNTAGWTIALSIFFFVFNFAYGAGPVVWTYVAEIYPLRYRARCIAVCTMANWIGNFLIAEFTPVLLDQIQFGTFFVFGFFCAIFAALSAWLPETKGVPLESVGQIFDRKIGFRNLTPAGDQDQAV
jgi:sugar porter (SP) family MFS transporter